MSYSWNTTSTSTNPGSYKVRIQELDGGGNPISDVLGDSSAPFNVIGTIVITTPPDNASPPSWLVNDNTKTIVWTKNPGSLGNVKVEYSIDDGSTWPGGAQIINASSSGTSQSWTPPSS